MGAQSRFIVVGENIHCTLVYKVGGAFVRAPEGQGAVIRYTDGGREHTVPVPRRFTESEEWSRGNLKHAAAAIWQGMHGGAAEAEAAKAYIGYLARKQEEAGASFLDLNVDEFSPDVQERLSALRWVAGVVQGASSLPLSIDSSNMRLLDEGLAACDPSRGKPMLNSVSLERLEAVELARRRKAVVLAGASGAQSMPRTPEERQANLRELMQSLRRAGFALSDVYLDPLVFPVSVDPSNGLNVLKSIAALRNEYGREIHFAPGLSNISFGMPNRKLLNQVFAWLCREEGMDGAIANPLHINGEILDRLDTTSEQFRLARAVLVAEDQFGMSYIEAARAGRI